MLCYLPYILDVFQKKLYFKKRYVNGTLIYLSIHWDIEKKYLRVVWIVAKN